MRLIDLLPNGTTADEEAVYAAIGTWVESRGLTLYLAQDEALIGCIAGSNVILATPTGSGKSIVATGAMAATLTRGECSSSFSTEQPKQWKLAPLHNCHGQTCRAGRGRHLQTDPAGANQNDARRGSEHGLELFAILEPTKHENPVGVSARHRQRSGWGTGHYQQLVLIRVRLGAGRLKVRGF